MSGIKVAFFIAHFGDGGVERTTLLLARGLTERGARVDLVTVRAEGPFLDQIPPAVNLVNLDKGRTLAALFKLSAYIKHEQPDAVISAQSYANVVTIWAHILAGRPGKLIVTERLAMSAATAYSRSWRERIMPLLMRWFYPKADAVVANSEAGADDLARFIGLTRQSVKTIYNPTVHSEITDLSNEPLEHPWFQPGDPPVILGVGRLSCQKDFATLIRAFALLREHRKARLVILGEGDERPNLEALTLELRVSQDTELVGFVPNPYKYMARADVFVLSSRYEGLPNSLIEALAVGTPVVSTDCPSGPDEILLHGSAGPMVPVGDYNGLASRVEELLADPSLAQSFLSKGQEHLYRFHTDTCVDNYLELIKK